QENLANSLASVRHRQGRLVGHMEALGFELQQQAELTALTDEVVKSSEIEGEKLDTNEVRSSIARRLGIDVGGLEPTDRHVEGVVEMMLDATRKYEQPLTADRLFGWHSALFPTGRSGMRKIRVGAWRDDSSGPMQVVSGPVGRERVHFEAPAAERLDQEMDRFLAWFNEKEATKAQIEPVLKAGVAHLWFVTIHPFDDGNGRIARAIADLALARAEHTPQRFYSMSAQIRQERSAYYHILEQTQKGSLDITPWLDWFLVCLGRAIDGAQATLGTVLHKARFWQALSSVPMNDCFFCSATENPLTEEHVWPQWVSRLLFGKYNSNHFVNIRSTGDNTTGLWKSRNIDVTTKTVCDKCNNVWLSSFENTEIKPI